MTLLTVGLVDVALDFSLRQQFVVDVRNVVRVEALSGEGKIEN